MGQYVVAVGAVVLIGKKVKRVIINIDLGLRLFVRFFSEFSGETATAKDHTIRNEIMISKHLFFIIAFPLLLFAGSVNADLLDNVKAKTKLVNGLKDLYRAFNICHVISDQTEQINLSRNDDSAELNNFLDSYIKVCGNLIKTPFTNDTLKRNTNIFLAATIQNYSIARAEGFESKRFKRAYKNYRMEKERYEYYLSRAYTMERFVNLPEKEYWKNNDKKNYIKSANYPAYLKLRESNLKAALTLLEKISAAPLNFQEYSVYQIEIADQYVKHPDNLGGDPPGFAADKYKAIIDKRRYSIYLFEAWLKWRAVTQQNNGLSKSSDIPNDKYNNVREQVALTVLNYVSSHPNDKMAINEFLLIATHDIVKRFGSYSFGNQNTVEFHKLFDDKK